MVLYAITKIDGMLPSFEQLKGSVRIKDKRGAAVKTMAFVPSIRTASLAGALSASWHENNVLPKA